MTDTTAHGAPGTPAAPDTATPGAAKPGGRKALVLSPEHLRKRYRAERRFRMYGLIAIGAAIAMLVLLLVVIVSKGWSAFYTYEATLEVYVDPAVVDPQDVRASLAVLGAADGNETPEEVNERATLEEAFSAILSKANYKRLIDESIAALFPDVSGRDANRDLRGLFSDGARYSLRDMVMADPSLIGQTIQLTAPLADDPIQVLKGNIERTLAGGVEGRLNEQQLIWLDDMVDRGLVGADFAWSFFSSADSRKPELAGIWGAIVGSIFTMLVTLVLAFPIAVAAAVYLEEFAPKNKWTDLIEVNINNLAAVPSIVFGLLGLAVFLQVFGLPRSAPIAGGMVLALMTLPTIIIATRAALKAVPPSIREAALGVGASHQQTINHHVLPLAMPGILTGTIIGMAQALGETAPLIMIGMVAFIAAAPADPLSPATVLPVQVYIWADSPERGFVEKTSAGIMVLLVFLIAMNAIAIILRKRFERRW